MHLPGSIEEIRLDLPASLAGVVSDNRLAAISTALCRRQVDFGQRRHGTEQNQNCYEYIPHLSCEAAWRAWWTVTESLPLPLRFCSKKIPKGPNHAAECTRLSRIKTVIVDPQTRICQFTFDSMLHVTGNPHCFILSQCSH
jgi:hypothetical protein